MPLDVFPSRENLGYTGGHNRSIAKAVERGIPWVLVLNTDVVLAPGFIATLLADAERPEHARVAAFTGKILRADGPDLAPTAVIDSVGIRMTPNGRHFDVGAGEPDDGRFDRPAEIFGASGCAVAVPDRGARRREDLDGLLRRRLLRLPRGRRPRVAPARPRLVRALRPGRGRLAPAAEPPGAPARDVRAREPPLRQEPLPPEDQQRGERRTSARRSSGRSSATPSSSPAASRWSARRSRRSAGSRENRARLLAKRAEIQGAPDGLRPRTSRAGSRTTRAARGSRRVRIAILGTRGVPAAYGGFETFAEELSARLAARGPRRDRLRAPRRDRRRGGRPPRRARRLPPRRCRHKYLEPSSTRRSPVSTRPRRATTPSSCATASTPSRAGSPRLLGAPTRVVLNVDGLERNRRKWNALGRLAYAVSERLSCVLPDVLVTDARAIQAYYREAYGQDSALHPVRLRPRRARRDGDARPPRPLARRLRPLRLALRAREQRRRRRARVPGRARHRAARPPRRRPLRGRVRRRREGRGRAGPARPPARRDLRRGLPRAPRARRRLRPRHGGRRDASGAPRGHGLRPAARRPRHAREPGDSRAARPSTSTRPAPRRSPGRSSALLADSELRRLSGEAALRRAREHYRWDAVTDAYEKALAGA